MRVYRRTYILIFIPLVSALTFHSSTASELLVAVADKQDTCVAVPIVTTSMLMT